MTVAVARDLDQPGSLVVAQRVGRDVEEVGDLGDPH